MGGYIAMIEEDMAMNDYVKEKEKKKHDWKAGRKFIAFILCLVAIVIMGAFDKGSACFPYIIGLFTAYTAGNVIQKATEKKDAEK